MQTPIFKNCKLTEQRQLEIIALKNQCNKMKGSERLKFHYNLFKTFTTEEKEAFDFLPTRVNFYEGWNNND